MATAEPANKDPHRGSHLTNAKNFVTPGSYALVDRGSLFRRLFLRGHQAPGHEEQIDRRPDAEVEHFHNLPRRMIAASLKQVVNIPAKARFLPSKTPDSSGRTGRAGLESVPSKLKLGRFLWLSRLFACRRLLP